MSRSIIPGNKDHTCFICGLVGITHRHHIFGGVRRNLSEKYGLVVNLCYEHHEGLSGAHGNRGQKLQKYLHELGQETLEDLWKNDPNVTKEDARNRFLREFQKSYL